MPVAAVGRRSSPGDDLSSLAAGTGRTGSGFRLLRLWPAVPNRKGDTMPDLASMYKEALQNTHAAERQGLVQMERQVDDLDDYPEYKSLLERHIGTTRSQLSRVEAGLSEIGAASATLREAVTATAGAVGSAVHGVMPDQTLKNLYAGYAYQAEQIAAYRSLAVIAKAAGHEAHVGWINDIVSEEEQAASAVAAIIPSVTERFLAKHAS
jgi:ferritin-like metal-binding protein YciE